MTRPTGEAVNLRDELMRIELEARLADGYGPGGRRDALLKITSIARLALTAKQLRCAGCDGDFQSPPIAYCDECDDPREECL